LPGLIPTRREGGRHDTAIDDSGLSRSRTDDPAPAPAALDLSRLAVSLRRDAISANQPVDPDMPDEGLSKLKRAELMAHVAELDQMIEDQMAHFKFVVEMGWNVPAIAVNLERLKESRRLYLSALRHLLGENIPGDEEPGGSR
jgi:hypothetical protein